ncbi:MAG: hypothetical protein ABIS29_06525 [Vicinamibacterales bacterium]
MIPRRLDAALGSGETPAILGVTIYVLLCWFAVQFGIPGKHTAAAFTAVVIVAALVRYRWLTGALRARGAISRDTRFWWTAFVLLYMLAYVYTVPPVGGEYLPIAWTGNIDLLTYIRYTRHLWDMGPSNLVGFEYLNFVYLQTPGVFYLMGWFSVLFGNDPLSAAMPAQFALTALIATLSARIAHSIFGIHRGAAVAIGAMVISAPFFRYIVGAYYLSTFITAPVFLYLLWTTLSLRPVQFFNLPVFIRFSSAYLLLLFTYPFLLFTGLAAQIGAILLMWVSELQAERSRWREVSRAAAASLIAIAASFGVVAVVFSDRLKWSLDMVTGLSQVGVAGWPLELISPLAVFGFPGVRGERIQVAPELRAWALVGFLLVALVLIWLYFWRFRRQASAAQKALVGLSAAGILAYCAYYLRVGPSYQQWKLASYTVLPFVFVVFAGVVRVTRESRRERVLATGLTVVGAFFIVGNLVVHARQDGPLIRLPGLLRSIEEIDKLQTFREMTLEMRGPWHVFETYLGLYFLPSKRVHVVSNVFEPSEKLSLDTISTARPLLLGGYGCEGVGHDETIALPNFGCLVLAPPSPMPDVSYSFKQSFVFIEWDRMTAREPGGRWNTRPTLNLRVTADPARARVAEDAHVNLFVNPFRRKDEKPIRLTFSWGKDRRGEFMLTEEEWISVPVRSADWVGNRAWALPVTIEFPGERTILFHELSVSAQPRGRVVTETGQPPS